MLCIITLISFGYLPTDVTLKGPCVWLKELYLLTTLRVEMTPEDKEPLLWVLKRDEEEATGKLQKMLGNEGPCQAECAAETILWDESRQKSSETVVTIAAYFLCKKNVLEQGSFPPGAPSAHQDPPQFFWPAQSSPASCWAIDMWN